ncbi:UDP-N-acetylglucosamine 1-carboxyvinyltransferase [Candidatus Uhrbacteria bacterium]|nr:UDP-N-acetylglucosamine 1-carboxyvinyltransferase [Candidatus Uhrbacteria bacterium]
MKFIINGGKKLHGTIHVSGSKNAVLPILAATLLADRRCVIHNVPRIRDVEVMMQLMLSVGRTVRWDGEHTIIVSDGKPSLKKLDPKLMRSFRASALFAGPLLTQFRTVRISEPGGCALGNRPLDDHFHGFRRMGVTIARSRGMYTLSHRGLEAKTIVLIAPSVTATENIVMTATLTVGTTVLKNAACEPHVQDLCDFLNSMGAKISGGGTNTITIQGVKKLHGTTHTVIPDPVNAMTFVIMGLATKSTIVVDGIRPDHLDVGLETLLAAGARFDIHKDSITLKSTGVLKAMKIQTRPYPGIPTDVQSQFGVLATQAQGTTLIHETIFDGRFAYIQELVNMGADATVCDPHRALITGPTPLHGHEIQSLNLRAGITLVVAALVASGQTVIHDAQIIDRGYEDIDIRLRALGADIRREA